MYPFGIITKDKLENDFHIQCLVIKWTIKPIGTVT